MDTPKIINFLKTVGNKNRSGRKFKCEFCDDIKLTLAGFAKHLRICKINVRTKFQMCIHILFILII